MNRGTVYIKTHPIIIGLSFWGMLMLCLIIVALVQRKDQTGEKFVPSDLERQETVQYFSYPEEISEYMISALVKNDLDMALRACAIDEMTMNTSFSQLYDNQTEKKELWAPAQSDMNYFSIASAEITEMFVEQIQDLENNKVLDLSESEIAEIKYAYPEKQIEDAYAEKAEEYCDIFGTNAICEIIVRLSYKRDIYITGFTIGKYDNYWKILGITSELADITENQLIRKVSEQEYKDIVDTADQGKMEKAITELMDGADRNEEASQELLPANYFITLGKREKSPQEVIRRFTVYLQKKNMGAMLAYGMENQPEKIETIGTEDSLLVQGEFAKEIKNLLYDFLVNNDKKEEYEEEQEEDIGLTLESQLNTQYIQYVELHNIWQVSDRSNCYVGGYYFGEKWHLAGFTVEKDETGYFIQTLSVEGTDLQGGNLIEITEEEYDRLGENGTISVEIINKFSELEKENYEE